jgi:hypothetical protein
MASERAIKAAQRIMRSPVIAPGQHGDGPPYPEKLLEQLLAQALDDFAAEAIVEASMQKAAATEVPEGLRRVATVVGVSRCEDCPFLEHWQDMQATRDGCRCPGADRDLLHDLACGPVTEALRRGARPKRCPLGACVVPRRTLDP